LCPEFDPTNHLFLRDSFVYSGRVIHLFIYFESFILFGEESIITPPFFLASSSTTGLLLFWKSDLYVPLLMKVTHPEHYGSGYLLTQSPCAVWGWVARRTLWHQFIGGAIMWLPSGTITLANPTTSRPARKHIKSDEYEETLQEICHRERC
jgi:hypothetical protein